MSQYPGKPSAEELRELGIPEPEEETPSQEEWEKLKEHAKSHLLNNPPSTMATETTKIEVEFVLKETYGGWVWGLERNGDPIVTSSVVHRDALSAFQEAREVKALAADATMPTHPNTGAPA